MGSPWWRAQPGERPTVPDENNPTGLAGCPEPPSREPGHAPDDLDAYGRFSAFNKARKAGRWHGANPAEDLDTRRVPEPIVNILAPEEVSPFFVAL
jgi:hypothetical protein